MLHLHGEIRKARSTKDPSLVMRIARGYVGRIRAASHRLASVTTAARIPTVPK